MVNVPPIDKKPDNDLVLKIFSISSIFFNSSASFFFSSSSSLSHSFFVEFGFASIVISAFFSKIGFDEIVTPNFSYSQHQSIDNVDELITVTDEVNNPVALRADSTLDVVRIITKRLGRTTTHKKWFYIQPIFSYPTIEEYQIGIEWLNENDFLKIV